MQYIINQEAEKIFALPSGKFDKNEYLTGKEVLPSYQSQMPEQPKLTFSPLGIAFEKKFKAI